MTKTIVTQTAAQIDRGRRQKENMADFIAKKREMFLVQMALDTKREEIRKLEEKALLKEEALRKSELMLEEDAIRFDTFLKENDKKAHEAIKEAEAKSKIKQEKNAELKKLQQQSQIMSTDIQKLKEQVEDCETYKNFLDELTPTDYIEQQKEKIREEKREQLYKEYVLKLGAWQAERDRLYADYEKAKEESRRKYRKKGEEIPLPVIPPEPTFDPTIINNMVIDEDQIPMYFQEPSQLLEIFSNLEESNLFLIQNTQQSEQALDDLQHQVIDTEKIMKRKTDDLNTNINELMGQISVEDKKAKEMKDKSLGREGDKDQEELLNQLTAKICDVYTSCGFDASANPSTLTMLTELEAKLDELLLKMDEMDPDYVMSSEKEKEKERRDQVRAERLKIQQEAYLERLNKAMERAQMPIQKKTGKQVMFRSAPTHSRKRKKPEDVNNQAKIDEARYFT